MTRLGGDRLAGFGACGATSAVLLGDLTPWAMLLGVAVCAVLGAWWFGVQGAKRAPPA